MDRHLIPRFLPETYRLAAEREDGALAAMLAAMEALHAPAERVIERIETVVAPHGAPDAFVPLLASWLGLEPYLEWSGGRPGRGLPRFRPGLGQLRLLTAEAAALRRDRGTAATLARFLALATGIDGFDVRDDAADGLARPFHVTVHAPAAAAAFAELIGRIVERERPAHATFDIVFATATDTATATATATADPAGRPSQ